MTAEISPSYADNQKVLWSTSNTNVVVVKDGVVSAVAYGEAIVTAKSDDGGKTAECAVVVKDAGATMTDECLSGSANCYIVSKAGLYKLKPFKGNSDTPVGNITVVETLWESFGNSTVPVMGDLIKLTSYKDGYIIFQTADVFKEGNAVIAAKDASDTILWPWHIWLTDVPLGQVYYNNAGTMMDRNLGATSAAPGDIAAIGLLYQWGRKDPFLGSSSISRGAESRSTITWPSTVPSNSSTGTIEYASSHPTTFIAPHGSNGDWCYTGLSSPDNTRWTTSDKSKSIYDPCPYGWRIPDGGSNGVWAKALGSSSSFGYTYNDINEGMNLSGKFGSDAIIWYPASGARYNEDGSFSRVGSEGYYWSASPDGHYAHHLQFCHYDSYVYPSGYEYRGRECAYSVRCVLE